MKQDSWSPHQTLLIPATSRTALSSLASRSLAWSKCGLAWSSGAERLLSSSRGESRCKSATASSLPSARGSCRLRTEGNLAKTGRARAAFCAGLSLRITEASEVPAPRVAFWMLPSTAVTGAAADFLPLQQGRPGGLATHHRWKQTLSFRVRLSYSLNPTTAR